MELNKTQIDSINDVKNAIEGALDEVEYLKIKLLILKNELDHVKNQEDIRMWNSELDHTENNLEFFKCLL